MSEAMTVITNNKPRELVTWHELPESQRQWFDYIGCEDDRYSPRFFAYRGSWYDASEFMRVPTEREAPQSGPSLKGWDGIATDTYFSGVLIRYPRESWGELDTDHVIVGRYYV